MRYLPALPKWLGPLLSTRTIGSQLTSTLGINIVNRDDEMYSFHELKWSCTYSVFSYKIFTTVHGVTKKIGIPEKPPLWLKLQSAECHHIFSHVHFTRKNISLDLKREQHHNACNVLSIKATNQITQLIPNALYEPVQQSLFVFCFMKMKNGRTPAKLLKKSYYEHYYITYYIITWLYYIITVFIFMYLFIIFIL